MKKVPLYILKIGGKLIEDNVMLEKVLDAFARRKGAKILVHGGGKKADMLCRQLGLVPRMINGRRITDEPTLEVVTMVYAGLVNKIIVARLQALGCQALGLSGADGNSILAHKRAVGEVDYGFAGDIDQVNTNGIRQWLAGRFCPVFCPITHNGQGQLLNTNADTIAAQLAIALAPYYELSLFYCFEKEGVLARPGDDSSVLSQLSLADYGHFRHIGVISDGMLPKLDNAFRAMGRDVMEVVIGGPQALEAGGGTKLQP